ncbi:hypothetical protein SNE40_011403 [Patella caerulea]|uniref:Uncharacterized protein n=1 Tax=Patella caerulea TaxID=87958 RepID=A0AAN8JMM0_PATCE
MGLQILNSFLYLWLCIWIVSGDDRKSISCQFEEEFCSWTPAQSYKYAWNRTDKATPDSTSGPHSNNTFGYFIYTHGYDAGKENISANLTSTSIHLPVAANFSFWYYMNGINIGSLTLRLLDPRTPENNQVLWSLSGRQGGMWKQAIVLLEGSSENDTIKLEFASTAMGPVGSDIALDDFVLSSEKQRNASGHTKPTITPTKQTITLEKGSCDFNPAMCDYTSLSINGSQVLWELRTHSDDTNFRGIPKGDGHYVYFKTSKIGSKNGEKAALVSPTLDAGGCGCLNISFEYIFSTAAMTLSVNLLDNGNYTELKKLTSNSITTWQQYKIDDVCVLDNQKLAFISERVTGYFFLGVDNIQITKGNCIHQQLPTIFCDFDSNLCHFNQSHNNVADWIVGTSESGPTIDFATGTGRYLYFSFNQSRLDTKARLLSPPIDANSYKCFLLRYKTNSTQNNTLGIYILTSDNQHPILPSWTLYDHPVSKWDQLEINIPQEPRGKNIQLLLEGEISSDNQGYLAIDNMEILTKPCKEKPNCSSDRCLNNGHCVESLASFVCICPPTFTGSTCETRVSPTSVIPPTTVSATTNAAALTTKVDISQPTISVSTPRIKNTSSVPMFSLFVTSTASVRKPTPSSMLSSSTSVSSTPMSEPLSSTVSNKNETNYLSEEQLSKGEKYALVVAGCCFTIVIILFLVSLYVKKRNKGADMFDDTFHLQMEQQDNNSRNRISTLYDDAGITVVKVASL